MINTQMIPTIINELRNDQGGQALVELVVIILICLMIGIGIYEAGAFFHNISVMNRAVESGAVMASHGAPYGEVRDVIVREAKNLIAGSFLAQDISEEGIFIEVWNPTSGNSLAPTVESDRFPPDQDNVAEYMFQAQGYEIRVGVEYNIGISMPFLSNITVDQLIVGSRTIQAPNDLDRDGMVDSQEAAYLEWRAAEDGKPRWRHPIHRDQTNQLDTNDPAPDIDGDAGKSPLPCKLKIVRVCTDESSCSNDLIEVFNPSSFEYTLGSVSEEVGGNRCSNCPVTLDPGESYLMVNGVTAGSTYNGATVDEDINSSLNNTNEGIRVEDDGGNYCDAVGWDATGTNANVGSGFFEDNVFNFTLDVEIKRLTGGDNTSKDTDDNSEDLQDPGSDLNPKSGFSKGPDEKPFDYNNNGTEDKFDEDNRSGDKENNLKWNHAVGPLDWPDTAPF